VGGGGCVGQLLGGRNSLRWCRTSEGRGEGGAAGFDGGGGAPAGSGGSEAGLRCEGVVRMNWSAEEKMGARVWLTRGRGGGSISDQILL
jgi:hypothetical protein